MDNLIELAAMQALDRAQQTVSLLEFTNQHRADLARIASATKGGYSLMRAVQALGEDRLAADAPLEADESAKIAKRIGCQPRPGNIFVPTSPARARRDLTAGTNQDGGYLVSAAALPGDMIVDALRASSVMLALGVRELPMSPGDQVIPKIGSATVKWLASEADTITGSTGTFGGIPVTPHSIGGYVECSRHWMKQTPQAQAFVFGGLAADVAAGVDKALLQGTNANGQPLGMLGATGVASASGAGMTWTKAVTALASVANANGIRTPSAAGWCVASDAALILRARERAAGSGFIMDEGRIAGYRAEESNSMPSGVAVFGDWSQLILATWGVLEVGADPFGNPSNPLFKLGKVGVRAIWSVDIATLQGASFSKLTAIS